MHTLDLLLRNMSFASPVHDVVEVFLKQLNVEPYRGKGILDFMGEAAGERAQFGKALGSAGALFEVANALCRATVPDVGRGHSQQHA